MRHLLEIDDLDAAELRTIVDLARHSPEPVLAGRSVGLIFEKPSTRTRHSTEVAVAQLGGHPVSTQGSDIGIDTRESAEDVSRTLSCYHALIGARVFEHSKVERLAAAASVPVVNLLSDASHPLQAIADVVTIEAELGSLAGRTVAYVGDPNNVFQSLALAVGMLGGSLRLGSPRSHPAPAELLGRLSSAGVQPQTFSQPEVAVEGADVVYTDVWTSMGQESQAEQRRRAFAGFAVDENLMEAAAKDAIFMHCLPAHRGEEATAQVVDGPRSRIWQQATNRMHAARAVLWWLDENARS